MLTREPGVAVDLLEVCEPIDRPVPGPGGDHHPVAPPRLRVPVRGAVVTHHVSLLLGLVVLAVLNRSNWFFVDDWDFLLRRTGQPLLSSALWQPHIDHWSTLPILGYRLLYAMVGAHTMWPYLGWALLAHLATAHLLWRLAVDCGARLWVATATTTVFVFLGAGAENLTWTFQATTNTSLLLGLAALLLVRREHGRSAPWTASLLLIGSLMCSNLGVFLLIAVGVFALATQGWRAALQVCGAPAAAFAVWYVSFGRHGDNVYVLDPTTVGRTPAFVLRALTSALDQTVGVAGGGAVIIAALTAWSLRHLDRRGDRAAPVMLAATAPLLCASISIGRYNLEGTTLTSRYVYLLVALLLPLLTIALSDAVRGAGHPRQALALVLAMCGFVLLTNLDSLRTYTHQRLESVRGAQQAVLASAWLVRSGEPLLTDHAHVAWGIDVTVAELRAAIADGHLDVPDAVPARLVDARVLLQVSTADRRATTVPFVLVDPGDGSASAPGCHRFVRSRPDAPAAILRPADGRGAALTIQPRPGDATIALRAADRASSIEVPVTLDTPVTLTDVAAGHDLLLRLPVGDTVVCGIVVPDPART